MTKNEIRTKYLSIRNNIENRYDKSRNMSDRFLSLISASNYNIIALYKSIGSEFDTNYLLDRLNYLGKTICLPKILGKDLVFIKYINGDELVKNEFGIYESVLIKENVIDIKDIDLFIVPGIVFDKSMNRIGYGKSFYDRCLANAKGLKVALIFDEQVINSLEDIENTDIKMDIIITDKHTILK